MDYNATLKGENYNYFDLKQKQKKNLYTVDNLFGEQQQKSICITVTFIWVTFNMTTEI